MSRFSFSKFTLGYFAVFMLAVGIFFFPNNVKAVETLILSQESGTNTQTTSGKYLCQKVLISQTNITAISFKNSYTGASSNSFQVRTGAGPAGSLLTSVTVYTPTADVWYKGIFATPLVGLSTSTPYYICAYNGAGGTSNVRISYSNPYAPYDYYYDGTLQSGKDMLFRIYSDVTVCGDSVKEGTEACDDGNTNNGDGCSSNCLIVGGCTCGNSSLEFYQNAYGTCYEACDDGNVVSHDGCSMYCEGETTSIVTLTGTNDFYGKAKTSAWAFFAPYLNHIKLFMTVAIGLIVFSMLLSLIVYAIYAGYRQLSRSAYVKAKHDKFTHSKFDHRSTNTAVLRATELPPIGSTYTGYLAGRFFKGGLYMGDKKMDDRLREKARKSGLNV